MRGSLAPKPSGGHRLAELEPHMARPLYEFRHVLLGRRRHIVCARARKSANVRSPQVLSAGPSHLDRAKFHAQPVTTQVGRRTAYMGAALLSTVSALAGSVIGGLTPSYTTWLKQRSQARAGMIARDLARREDLIRDFILEASKADGDAFGSTEPRWRRSSTSTPWSADASSRCRDR
jgi:hypothetical protein